MKNKLILSLILLIFISSVYAAKVSPVRFDITVARGKTQEFSLNLIGSKGHALQKLMVFPSDLSMDRRGALNFNRIESWHSVVPFIKINTKRVELLESESKEIKYKVSVPLSAKPGEYYGVILVEPEEFTSVRKKDAPMVMKMKTRVAVVVVLNVPGRIYEKKGQAFDMSLSEKAGVININSTFKNLGNIHLDVLGEAVVKTASGTVYARLKLKPISSSKERAFVFPGALRDFSGSLDRPLPNGEYIVDISYEYGLASRKVRMAKKITIKRSIPVDESKAEYISIKESSFKALIREGGTAIKYLEITNVDYRPIDLVFESKDEVSVRPSSLTLKSGETKKVMLRIKVSKYSSAVENLSVDVIPNRGKGEKVKIIASSDKKELEGISL
jgi:hypothetical protein